MPELPEVERGRKIAESVALGRRIKRVQCHEDEIVFQGVAPSDFAAALKGKTVLAVKRRGKQIWFELDRAPHPLFHFGMTGAFYSPTSEHLKLATGPRTLSGDWPPRFWKILIEFDDGGELCMTNARRLGRILLREEPETSPPISKLGFDPLIDMPTPKEFEALLRHRKARIKAVLLDQSFCAGIGNWIADEILYQAKIAPLRLACDLDVAEVSALRSRLKTIVDRTVAVDADKSRLPKSWLFHRRWGKKTGTKTLDGLAIEHLDVGGRTTAWVPKRQR
ncbi:MAG: DNA-formamidopyrimidine glycosylase family protein [Planctomycetota bacterium]